MAKQLQDLHIDISLKERVMYSTSDRSRMPEHEYVDLKITYKPNDKDWYISLYGKN